MISIIIVSVCLYATIQIYMFISIWDKIDYLYWKTRVLEKEKYALLDYIRECRKEVEKLQKAVFIGEGEKK